MLKKERQVKVRYVFISYSSKDIELADKVKILLNKNGIETWMATCDIPAGSKYAELLIRAIRNCGCLLLLLTHDSQNSVWVAKEVERAINYKKTIIPVQIEDVVLNDEFEMYISENQILSIKEIDDTTSEFQSLIKAIKANLEIKLNKDNYPKITVEDLLKGIKTNTEVKSANDNYPKITEEDLLKGLKSKK